MLALWCVYQSACKVASYLLGAIISVLKALGTRVGAHGARPGEGRGRAFLAKTHAGTAPPHAAPGHTQKAAQQAAVTHALGCASRWLKQPHVTVVITVDSPTTLHDLQSEAAPRGRRRQQCGRVAFASLLVSAGIQVAVEGAGDARGRRHAGRRRWSFSLGDYLIRKHGTRSSGRHTS